MDHPFQYHQSDAEEIQRIEDIRAAFHDCLIRTHANTRPGSVARYGGPAKTALEETALWVARSAVFERGNGS